MRSKLQLRDALSLTKPYRPSISRKPVRKIWISSIFFLRKLRVRPSLARPHCSSKAFDSCSAYSMCIWGMHACFFASVQHPR